MAFNIEEMKADGVSAHLIELASIDEATLLLLVARRLEHDALYQQFMASEVGEIKELYRYAIAAGVMTKADMEWLTDTENPYLVTDEQGGLLGPGDVKPGGSSGSDMM